jgi:hypothetical protein
MSSWAAAIWGSGAAAGRSVVGDVAAAHKGGQLGPPRPANVSKCYAWPRPPCATALVRAPHLALQRLQPVAARQEVLLRLAHHPQPLARALLGAPRFGRRTRALLR